MCQCMTRFSCARLRVYVPVIAIKTISRDEEQGNFHSLAKKGKKKRLEKLWRTPTVGKHSRQFDIIIGIIITILFGKFPFESHFRGCLLVIDWKLQSLQRKCQ